MEADLKYYVQAIITVVLLTDPFMRPMLFKSMTAHEPEKRGAYVRTIIIVVGVTLGVSALAGRELLELVRINPARVQRRRRPGARADGVRDALRGGAVPHTGRG